AIREHQVVVVAGETGSGKSTQLPKLCIEAGRGTSGVIGHTQPRRVAARTIAERVAEEMGSPLGADVGYAVRFTDTVGPATVVKVMTDGILLAEIQRDRELRRYDTLIIDEAHERSLNIDFILGYLRELLPRRPDLSVIVTSATIDTARFARHFARGGVVAPIVEVSGRSYPVEIRYRPYEEDERDQVQAILDAVDELRREPDGDVLVFLSGEREIHDTADALRRLEQPGLEVLPLYARLSAPEQHRIFQPHRGRRIVLATNVAETSLTVPGIRYVVDAGRARISRYSRRLKVQQLPIEPVSQASADQRAGRCGRVAPGICIRLYTEEDFSVRPEFTEPEILRTNLASVILQMTSIGLGDVSAFPFVEPPDGPAIRDGYLLLEELDAIGAAGSAERSPGGRRLTKIGRGLARLPIDPRLGRMVLEAERHGCVREVLVIASALSIQDVRERPEDKREQANEMHNRFRVAGSDLLSTVALWDYLRQQQRERSGNQFRRMCRTEFLHYLRVREWMDLYSQLRRVAGDLGIRPTTEESHPDLIHRSVLAGLLSHVGVRQGDRRDYRGARQAEFVIAPGSALTRRPPEWVMAAELVETSRLFARQVAGIDPAWAESAGAHLVKRSYGEPRWDSDGGRAVVTESVTLYGLPLVTDRVIGYDRVDAAAARAWFVSKALVEGDAPEQWIERQGFLARNRTFLERIESIAARARRAEIVDEEALFVFYDDRVGDDVTSVRHFDRWWKRAPRRDEHRLDLTDDIVGEHGVDPGDYPDVWRQGDVELPLTYRFAPGEPLDGATVHLPLSGLNQVADDGFDWQIPGYRDDLVSALLRTLPKATRRQLIPLAETTAAVIERLGAPRGRLVDELAEAVSEVAGVAVSAADFDDSVLPDDLRLHFVVSADDGEVHDVGTDLTEIKRRLAGTARASIAAAAPIEERRGITRWDVGDLPRVVETSDRGFDVRGYPTLLDVGSSVSLRVVSDPDLQRRALHGGVRRLLLLSAAPSAASVERSLQGAQRLALVGGDIPPADLVADCVAAAVDRVMLD
ncbi:MAG: ATP-dependent RNA helicase HrpA, partial [Ilumatobacteraceae bacterium]